MIRFRILLNWIVPPLNRLEKKILHALIQQLAADAKEIVSRQIAQINLVQRHAAHKEINLYCIRKGEPYYDEKLSLPIGKIERKIASVAFKVTDAITRFKADIWVVNGHLFSIIFDQSPKGLCVDKVQIEHVVILIDPMKMISASDITGKTHIELHGWLRAWAEKYSVCEFRTPLNSAQRDKLIAQISAELPSEYIELIIQTDGLRVDGCIILGLAEIRDLIFSEMSYLILAELEGQGVFAVSQSNRDNEIYFFDYEDNRRASLGSSFRVAIEKKMLNAGAERHRA